jgi:hypothetical protein
MEQLHRLCCDLCKARHNQLSHIQSACNPYQLKIQLATGETRAPNFSVTATFRNNHAEPSLNSTAEDGRLAKELRNKFYMIH